MLEDLTIADGELEEMIKGSLVGANELNSRRLAAVTRAAPEPMEVGTGGFEDEGTIVRARDDGEDWQEKGQTPIFGEA